MVYLFHYKDRSDKKHTREENVVFRENFIFFHTLVAEE